MELFESISVNPYFSAGFGLLGVGTGMAILRTVAFKSVHLLQRRFLLKLEIPSRDPSYNWVLQWLTNHASQSTQHLSVQTLNKQHSNGSMTSSFNMIPSPGVHYLRWMNRWIKVLE
jgi:chaperone BCS1